MPKSDDELRALFQEGRQEDRQAAPPFEATWEAQASSRPRRVWPIALAAAAAVAVAAAWLVGSPDAPSPQTEQVAETNPLPDLPSEPAEGVELDAELTELAAWAPTRLDAPTDFLLDEDGVLAGGLPTSDLNDPILDLEDFSTEL